MNNSVLKIILSFIGLVLLQVLVCSNMNFMGEINPFVYVVFVLLYPVINNRLLFIFTSFLLGLILCFYYAFTMFNTMLFTRLAGNTMFFTRFPSNAMFFTMFDTMF